MVDGVRPDRSLGVDDATLAVYDGLVRLQPTGAAALAEHVGIDEQAATDALARLVAAGLARVHDDGSGRFRAEVPDGVLDDLVSSRLDALDASATALREARDLAARVRTLYHAVTQSRNALEFERLVGADEISTRIAELSARTTTSLEGVMTAVPKARMIEQARESEERLVRRGVVLRSLYRAPARRSDALANHGTWLAEHGGQIRTTARPLPTQYVLFDRTVGLVAFHDRELAGPAAVVLSTREVIACLGMLFDTLWEAALPLPAPVVVAPDDGPTPHEREILTLMHAGLKDEAIARELGVSTKTVRRIVSSLTERLGLKDRFSLGVLAGARGWLDDATADVR
ncbi:helix-turn-helix transcriptional regulator [Isoptericola variabilis]|uniref:Regulatory protein LuxR n=1 Tax=Isoptericola variabilis (strain 225) TaxID=743718 RepID=F6FQT6_ISOV2|nr:helix-turn-helix transcriptional regulator [Isoptericola variabilis]AEG42901.1 regulatory protein LuxR [Isoptericola variabilis 225]TWH30208.1 Response regulator containing a CheY-like receiver domain and an HTH DNA-binding domain [Isoptericola variabilis J7]